MKPPAESCLVFTHDQRVIQIDVNYIHRKDKTNFSISREVTPPPPHVTVEGNHDFHCLVKSSSGIVLRATETVRISARPVRGKVAGFRCRVLRNRILAVIRCGVIRLTEAEIPLEVLARNAADKGCALVAAVAEAPERILSPLTAIPVGDSRRMAKTEPDKTRPPFPLFTLNNYNLCNYHRASDYTCR